MKAPTVFETSSIESVTASIPTLTFSPSSATQITFGYEHFYDSRTADRGIPSFDGRPADLPIETYFGNPDDAYARARVNLLSGTIQHQLGRAEHSQSHTLW